LELNAKIQPTIRTFCPFFSTGGVRVTTGVSLRKK
jgi:hypothetical protein